MTRENYLHDAARHLCSDILQEKLPKVKISVGFPSTRALSSRSRRVGECWSSKACEDQTAMIFVSPTLHDTPTVLAVLLHELIHAIVGTECGHRGAFRKLWKFAGFQGKATESDPSPELLERLNALAERLGPYPQPAFNPGASGRKKQSTRLLKAACSECGYTVRVTQKWADMGLPTCPCGSGFALVS